MEYKKTKDFMKSLRDLNSKGGSFKKAADRIMVVVCKASQPSFTIPDQGMLSAPKG